MDVYANLLGVMLKRVGDDLYMNLPVNITNVKEGKADKSYIHEKGTFYLEINNMSELGTYK